MRRYTLGAFIGTALVIALASPLTDASARITTSRTAVVTVGPFTSDGHLRPGIRVTRQRHGSCLGSILMTDAAYRCDSGNVLLDPCWRDARTKRPAVVCLATPWAHSATRLLLKKFPYRPSGGTNFKAEPWGIQTASGARCLVFEGAHDSVPGPKGRMFVVDYYCGSGSKLELVRGIDRSGATWRIRAVSYTGKFRPPYRWHGWVPIRTAWFGHSYASRPRPRA